MEAGERLGGVSLEEVDRRASLRRRMDRKYILPRAAFEAVLADLPAGYEVLEIDGHRTFRYESVYFDTRHLRCFHEHINGVAPRFKARTRLYAETEACFFEAKIKTADGETLKSQLDIDTREHGVMEDDKRRFLASALEGCGVAPPEQLERSLVTRFRRITLSAGGAPERVTADLDLEMLLSGGRSARIRDGRVLIETKTEEGEGAFDDALAEAGFESVSLSKYRAGIALLAASDPGNPLGADLSRYFETDQDPAGSRGRKAREG